jgi:hypothetical protein
MYSLRDMSNLVKLANKHFKTKSRPNFVHITLVCVAREAFNNEIGKLQCLVCFIVVWGKCCDFLKMSIFDS